MSLIVKFFEAGGRIKADVVSSSGAAIHGEIEFTSDQVGKWIEKKISIDPECYTECIATRLTTGGPKALIRFGSQIIRS